MKKSKYTDEQIAFALKQAELGTSVDEVCRKMAISDATFYDWRSAKSPKEVIPRGRPGGLRIQHSTKRRPLRARPRACGGWQIRPPWRAPFRRSPAHAAA